MSVETDITLIIKTFERPECLQRLITSVQKFYPCIAVVVVDDSRNPIPISGVEYCVLPFATGTSIGRNKALSKVKTEYFMTLDDDFIFTERTNLQIRHNVLSNTDIDLVGTNVDDNQVRRGMLVHIQDGVFYRWNASKGESFGHLLYDYVPQCFVARTEKFQKAGGWDNDFLVWDHEAMFLRIHGSLKITMLSIIDILHKPATNPVYKDHRWGSRLQRDRLRLNAKYQIRAVKLLQEPPGWTKQKRDTQC